LGERQQIVTIRGTDLDRLERLESERADIQLRAPGEDRSQREAVVTLRAGAQAGDRADVSAKVQGMTALIRFPGVLQIAGARPRIVEAKSSLPADLASAPREGEIPAGSFVSFSLRVEPSNINPAMTLRCAEEGRTSQEIKLATGERRANAQLTSAGAGSLFLSVDPGAVGSSGCTLTAKIETEALGASDAFTLGKVVRFPRIEALKLSNEALAGGFAGSLDGWDLESIERTGWSANNGLPVTELPRPIAGDGAKQTLRIAVPWPAPTPKAPLFIWLRGETEGRATRISP
jgi:hypothetical protein